MTQHSSPSQERARRIIEERGATDSYPGTDLRLGEALWESGRDRKRARALIESALKQTADESAYAQAKAWLASHPAAP